MANTTFNGPVRSENGFNAISVASGTGAVTTDSTFDNNTSIGGTLTVTGATSLEVGIANPTGMIAATGAKTQMANGFAAAMVKNTHYLAPANGAAITATLPAASASTAGDIIIVDWHVAVTNGATQKFGTAGEFFEVSSVVYKTTTVLAVIFAADVADGTGDDFLNMIGLTNAGPGVGSRIVFSFNGTVWRADAISTTSGTGAAAGTSVFATS
jgi:filamentous hemagglutinin family protein|tara:strand:+ start:490 stop:1128 length:639 start_codon:yes stop_codon:yes gene_type:complete